MSELHDVEIKCQDCGTPFVLTEGEQRWFIDKFGKDYRAPKRCRSCRQRRKQEGGSGPRDSSSNRRHEDDDKF